MIILGIPAKPWELNPAIRKCFKKYIYIITLPELNARKILLELNIKNTFHSLTNEQIDFLAKYTELFSHCDFYSLLKDAIYGHFRKCLSVEYFKKIKE